MCEGVGCGAVAWCGVGREGSRKVSDTFVDDVSLAMPHHGLAPNSGVMSLWT